MGRDEDSRQIQIISLQIIAHNQHLFWRSCDRQNQRLMFLMLLSVCSNLFPMVTSPFYSRKDAKVHNYDLRRHQNYKRVFTYAITIAVTTCEYANDQPIDYRNIRAGALRKREEK